MKKDIFNTSSLISIGMPVRNNQETLAAAVQSIVNQTYPHWELLLINDGSTDETLHVAKSFTDTRIKIYSDKLSLGLPARLNQALELSQGVYFARMDGDDISYPERFERQVRFLEEHPEISLVGAWMLMYNPGGQVLGKRITPEDHATICRRPHSGFPIGHATFMGHTDFFRRYMYRVSAIRCEDQDFLLRAYRDNIFANIPEILYGVNEDLDLTKILRTRRHFAESLFREFRYQGRPRLAMQAAVEQGLKAVVDTIAVTSGMNYRLLRHRAQPVTAIEQQRWDQVWHQLNPSRA